MWFNHSMQPNSFSHILFDWGDTVMLDDPAQSAPMVEWLEVRAVTGVDQVLARLKTAGKTICLATSADVSDEIQIRAALARVDLDQYFDRIFSFKNTGLPKSEAFYRKVLHDLKITPSQALMIGDSFAKDVLAANAVGMAAIWLNEKTKDEKHAEIHLTVHSMAELLAWFSAN
jgi:putative hydrolase of the HAD superfamily